jgi:hypothetical protein
MNYFYVLSFLAFVSGLLWLGFQIQPKLFPVNKQETTQEQAQPVPENLPEPVARYFKKCLGDSFQPVTSALVVGRPRARLSGIRVPMRYRSAYLPGSGFARQLQITWFGLPVINGRESFIHGQAKTRIGKRESEASEKLDQSANLLLWAESVWMPSALLTDDRLRWEKVDDYTVHLSVPFGEEEDRFLVSFDEESDLIKSMSAMRYKDVESDKRLWKVEYQAWDEINGQLLPRELVMCWEDAPTPSMIWILEDIHYNLDVSAYFEAL